MRMDLKILAKPEKEHLNKELELDYSYSRLKNADERTRILYVRILWLSSLIVYYKKNSHLNFNVQLEFIRRCAYERGMSLVEKV